MQASTARKWFSLTPARIALLLGAAVCGLALGCLSQPGQAADAPLPKAQLSEFKPFTQEVSGTDIKFDMLPIPGGKFTMGSPESEKRRKADEGPQVEVTVEPFYMGKYEVTWDIYNEYLKVYGEIGAKQLPSPPVSKLADAVSYPTPIYDADAAPILQRMGGRTGEFPAVIMSHFAAKQFTKWLSVKTGRFYRLPTEAEWEYAARAGAKTAYFFGNDPKQLKDYAWFTDNAQLKDGVVGYHRIGLKKPNPFGLYDIYGNVAEIVFDQYEPEHYASLSGKQANCKDAIRWPDKQYPRVVRGGGYESEPEQCRSAARRRISVAQNTQDPQDPKSPYWWTEGFSIGFRLVSPVTEPTKEEKHKFWDVDNERVREVLERPREIRQMVNELVPKN
jgi:formylglycine-generating enzyme required for sulfatase activity